MSEQEVIDAFKKGDPDVFSMDHGEYLIETAGDCVLGEGAATCTMELQNENHDVIWSDVNSISPGIYQLNHPDEYDESMGLIEVWGDDNFNIFDLWNKFYEYCGSDENQDLFPNSDDGYLEYSDMDDFAHWIYKEKGYRAKRIYINETVN